MVLIALSTILFKCLKTLKKRKYQRFVQFTNILFKLGAFIVLGKPDDLVQFEPEVIDKPWRGVDIKSYIGKYTYIVFASEL